MPELTFRDLDRGATYGIPADLTERLFNRLQPSAPVDFLATRRTQEPTNVLGSRIKKESLARLATFASKGKA